MSKSRKGQKKSVSRRAPHKAWGTYLVAGAACGVGWVFGLLGPVWWVLAAFFGAAAGGIAYTSHLARARDQYANVARQVPGPWSGSDRVPLAEASAALLLALWIGMLWLSMERYPRPDLVSAATGGLWALLGMVARAGYDAYRNGCPHVPPDKKVILSARKATKGGGRSRMGLYQWGVGGAALLSAAGVLLLGSPFSWHLLDGTTDRWLGSLLLPTGGLVVVGILFRYRLEPVADRLEAMEKLANELARGRDDG